MFLERRYRKAQVEVCRKYDDTFRYIEKVMNSCVTPFQAYNCVNWAHSIIISLLEQGDHIPIEHYHALKDYVSTKEGIIKTIYERKLDEIEKNGH